MLIRHLTESCIKLSSPRNISRIRLSRFNGFNPTHALTLRNMSAAAHPVSSTSDPAPPAEGLAPVGAGNVSQSGSKPQQQKKDGKAGKEKKDKKAGNSSGPLELNPPPEFFAERMKIFDEYKAKYDKWVAGASHTARPQGCR